MEQELEKDVKCSACMENILYEDAVSTESSYYCFPCADFIYDFDFFEKVEH